MRSAATHCRRAALAFIIKVAARVWPRQRVRRSAPARVDGLLPHEAVHGAHAHDPGQGLRGGPRLRHPLRRHSALLLLLQHRVRRGGPRCARVRGKQVVLLPARRQLRVAKLPLLRAHHVFVRRRLRKAKAVHRLVLHHLDGHAALGAKRLLSQRTHPRPKRALLGVDELVVVILTVGVRERQQVGGALHAHAGPLVGCHVLAGRRQSLSPRILLLRTHLR